MNLSPSLGAPCAAPEDYSPPASYDDLSIPAHACRHRRQHALTGYSMTRIVMEFMRWAVEREQFPTVESIMRRFEVSRATAYRWRAALGETYQLSELPANELERAQLRPAGEGSRDGR